MILVSNGKLSVILDLYFPFLLEINCLLLTRGTLLSLVKDICILTFKIENGQLVWNNINILKHSLITWLLIHGKLRIKDSQTSMGFYIEDPTLSSLMQMLLRFGSFVL